MSTGFNLPGPLHVTYHSRYTYLIFTCITSIVLVWCSHSLTTHFIHHTFHSQHIHNPDLQFSNILKHYQLLFKLHVPSVLLLQDTAPLFPSLMISFLYHLQSVSPYLLYMCVCSNTSPIAPCSSYCTFTSFSPQRHPHPFYHRGHLPCLSGNVISAFSNVKLF